MIRSPASKRLLSSYCRPLSQKGAQTQASLIRGEATAWAATAGVWFEIQTVYTPIQLFLKPTVYTLVALAKQSTCNIETQPLGAPSVFDRKHACSTLRDLSGFRCKILPPTTTPHLRRLTSSSPPTPVPPWSCQVRVLGGLSSHIAPPPSWHIRNESGELSGWQYPLTKTVPLSCRSTR